MGKPNQVLLLDPKYQLKFQGTFKKHVSTTLKLINPTQRQVLYKITPQSANKYCIRPNFGSLDPLHLIEIAICVQPFDYQPYDEKKHSFLIQSMFTPDLERNPKVLWMEARSEELMSTELECVFEPPEPPFVPPEKNLDPVLPMLSYTIQAEEQILEKNLPTLGLEKLESSGQEELCESDTCSEPECRPDACVHPVHDLLRKDSAPCKCKTLRKRKQGYLSTDDETTDGEDNFKDLKQKNYRLLQEITALQELNKCVTSEDHVTPKGAWYLSIKVLCISSFMMLILGIILGKFIFVRA